MFQHVIAHKVLHLWTEGAPSQSCGGITAEVTSLAWHNTFVCLLCDGPALIGGGLALVLGIQKCLKGPSESQDGY